LTNLDEELQNELLTLLCQEVEHNRTDLIYVTHNPEEARALATRTVRLHQGRVQNDSQPEKAGLAETPLVQASRHGLSG
jgi:ABC-type thiamine transport system ATPase subunit